MSNTPIEQQQYIQRECGHGKYLPTGEFRPLRAGEHYLGVKQNHKIRGIDAAPPGDWECALTHMGDDWAQGPAMVILREVEDCADHNCAEGA